MSKNLRTLMCVMFCLFAVMSATVCAYAAEDGTYTEGYYTYTVTDGKATITDVDTAISGDITIPSTLGGYPVVTIGDSAFMYCSKLANLSIPDSVMFIGDSAFDSCTSLANINIPSGVTAIGYNTFFYCTSLESIYIPDNVTTIGKGAFKYCSNLTDVTIPSNTISIGSYAFQY